MNKKSFRGGILSCALVIIAVITYQPSASAGLDEKSKFVEYVSPGNYFKCSIPAGWSIYNPGFGLSEEEKKVYGVTLFGPQNGSPVPPTISIHYYAPGNLLDDKMDKYVEGHSYGEVRQITIAGRDAKTFERTYMRSIGPRAINMPKVSMYEKYIVIPAKKNEGYYVLKLSVPVEIKDNYTGIFEESVKSFLPER
jgi:hypothetical protein